MLVLFDNVTAQAYILTIETVRTKSMTTKHTCNGGNNPVFGRKTPGCARCDELLAGAPAVKGWGDRKRAMEAEQIRAIHAHFHGEYHRSGKCGPVCTFGEW
jgi:hypothetical protein